MKKNKTIFLLGTAFFLFALIKYGFTPNQMSTAFIAFETLSFMVVLFLIYYILNFIEACKHSSNHTDDDRECIQRQIEINKLKKKLAFYETSNKNTIEMQVDSDSLLQQLQQNLSENLEQSSKNIFSVIKHNFELMAGIAYCSNSENTFTPVKTMGLDDDWHIEPINNGDGLHGQAIADNTAIEIEDIPEDYFEMSSGSGSAKPKYIYILPLLNDDSKGIVIEIAAFKQLNIIPVWNQLTAKA